MKLVSPYTSSARPVNFKFRAARKGAKHLIVIFTSIRADRSWLDFDHDGPLLAHNRANLLWIYDNFGAEYSYYLTENRDFEIEAAVSQLIAEVIDQLGLSSNDCTMVGMSKGGSAALRLGIKCNAKNILALTPQLAIGSYLLNRKRTAIIEYMSGNTLAPDIEWLNSLVPEVVRSDSNRDRNVYLITSPYDPHCIDYLDEVLPYFRRYSNFSLISTASDLTRNHLQTLHYNVPFVVSLLTILAEGLAPRFGEDSNGFGFDGSGHRDKHFKLGPKHGGLLAGPG